MLLIPTTQTYGENLFRLRVIFKQWELMNSAWSEKWFKKYSININEKMDNLKMSLKYLTSLDILTFVRLWKVN